jgi:hypothetical protein
MIRTSLLLLQKILLPTIKLVAIQLDLFNRKILEREKTNLSATEVVHELKILKQFCMERTILLHKELNYCYGITGQKILIPQLLMEMRHHLIKVFLSHNTIQNKEIIFSNSLHSHLLPSSPSNVTERYKYCKYLIHLQGSTAYWSRSVIPSSLRISSSTVKFPVNVFESRQKMAYAASATISGFREMRAASFPLSISMAAV